ncbi:hypothetical protein UPYG_G00236630 [Umbra pygmaea]|uniref:Uncharacterized protein n=1 Tax=Umbra pygmaea TaxID=75934 RepID=A0ABD0X0L8_UMBPY
MSVPPRCCICLDAFTRPVIIPCGHRFCLSCIGEYWRQCACHCPLCKTCFPIRPQLTMDNMLHIGAPYDVNGASEKTEELPQIQTDHIQRTAALGQESQTQIKSGEVPCDVCPGNLRRAVKSCLVCLASFCEAHLEPHYMETSLGCHPLVGVWKNLEEPVCRLHGRQLEKFCRSDQTLICAMCSQTDHRGHRLITINREATKRRVKIKKHLMRVQQVITEKRRKVEDLQHSLEIVKGGEEKQDAPERRAEGLIKDLEQEITDLKRRSSELEQLSQTEDHIHLLQAVAVNENLFRANLPGKKKRDSHQSSVLFKLRTGPISSSLCSMNSRRSWR